MIEIDGSLLEGGGQMIRMSVGLSSLFKKPIRIINIRSNRSKPGLKSQHMTGIQLVQQLSPSSVNLTGVTLHSNEMTLNYNFTTGDLLSTDSFTADIQTAGAVTLLSQISLPVALFLINTKSSKIKLNLKGGTNADFAPTIDYYDRIFRPYVRRFGIEFDIDVVKKGYFPRGGGEVNLLINSRNGTPLNPITLEEKGDILSVEIYSSVAGRVDLKDAQIMADSAKKTLEKKFGTTLHITVHAYQESNYFGNGSSITLVSKTSSGMIFGGSAVGSPKMKPVKTGVHAAEDLLKSLLNPWSCVDDYLQDQLVIFMALAKGRSKVITGPLTLHTKSAIFIAETLSDAKFNIVSENDGQSLCITCDGIGFSSNPN